MNHEDEFTRCQRLMRGLLTAEQREIVDGPPQWDHQPPQRESYLSTIQYVFGLKKYADRVLAARKVAELATP